LSPAENLRQNSNSALLAVCAAAGMQFGRSFEYVSLLDRFFKFVTWVLFVGSSCGYCCMYREADIARRLLL